MKLKNIIIPLVLLMLFGATVCAAEKSPVEVKVKPGANAGVLVSVTSIAHIVTIQDVKLNRGRTAIFNSSPQLPTILKFGQSVTLATFNPTVQEVEVQTDKGSWSFKFK